MLLETNKYFTFEKEVECKGIKFELYNDDCGQCYVLAWTENGRVKSWSCGTFNDYVLEMEGIAVYLNEKGIKQ